MNIVALETAEDRLVLCRRAHEALVGSATRQRAFLAHWLDFLVQWKGVYSKIQQAAKSSPAEIQWFGLVNKERKADPLLRYLFEARNDGEHGINRSFKHGADQYHIESATGGPVEITNFVPGPDGRLRFVGADGSEVAKVTHFVPGEADLVEVTEYDGKKKVPPPTMHLGQPIEPKPLIAAELGLRWLEALVATARAMLGP